MSRKGKRDVRFADAAGAGLAYIVGRAAVSKVTAADEMSLLARAALLAATGGLVGWFAAPMLRGARDTTSRGIVASAGALAGIYDAIIGDRVPMLAGTAVSGLIGFYGGTPAYRALAEGYEPLEIED